MGDECSEHGGVVAARPQPGEILTEEGHVRPEAVGHDPGREGQELAVSTDTGDIHWRVAT